MLARAKEFIGDLWGQTTTQGLAFLVMIQPVLAGIAPSLMSRPIQWSIFGVTASIAVLRFFAPPPPAVTIKKDDAVIVNEAVGAVTIVKAGDIPIGVVSKVAGEKV